MSLSYGVLDDASPDRTLEGPIEVNIRATVIQHQVDGRGSRAVMLFLPILQGVPPEAPKLWSERCNFEPVVVDEKEVVRSLS